MGCKKIKKGKKMNPSVKKYLSKIGKKGGKVTSEIKTEKCKENGKLGGRPVKQISWIDVTADDGANEFLSISDICKRIQEPVKKSVSRHVAWSLLIKLFGTCVKKYKVKMS